MSHFKDAMRYDLLDSSESLRLARQPDLLYQELKATAPGTWVVIDEIQKVPALLNEVHRLIENHQIKFILSGSSARKLKRGGDNLLAGRALVTSFFPLVSAEVNFEFGDSDRYIYGMLPKAFLSLKPQSFLRSYTQTYLKEEIQTEALIRNIGGFARFLEIAARQNGQTTNVSNIARDAQVARQTVQGYFDILIDTLLGFWLPTWKLKPGVKQVSHPKFYFFDAGVCRALSGRLPFPPLPEEKGALFETWILHEIRAYLSYSDLHYPVYYWSSHDQVEVDVFLETTKGFVAIELKSTLEWQKSFNLGLIRMKEELPRHSVTTIGVYCGKRAMEYEGIQVFPYAEFLKKLWAGEMIR